MDVLAVSGTDIAAIVGASAAVVAAIGSSAAAIIGAVNGHNQRVPSGGTIGAKVEQAHDLAAANAASLKQVHERLNGENVLPLRPDSKAADA